MRYAFTSLLALASVFTVAACGPAEDAEYEPGTPGEDPIDVRETPLPEYTAAVESDFTPAGDAEAAITGTLHLMEPTSAAGPGAPMRIRVQVSGLPAGEHAWHVHAGPCGTQGEVVVPFTSTEEREGVAQALMPDDAGVAEVEVDVPGLAERWMGSGDHSVHIHREAGTEHGPTIACATL